MPSGLSLCAHCRLPVPHGLLRNGAAHQFCCNGCASAHSVIHSCGLENYYRLVDRAEGSPSPARTTRRGYAEFDDPVFQALYCRPLPNGLLATELVLEGVHCGACIWLLEKLPRAVPGVAEARLEVRRATICLTYDPARVTLSRVGRVLDSLGYPPHPARGPAAREARRCEDRRMLIRMAVAGACAGNIMLLFFALYAGMFEGIEHGYEQMFRWIAMLLNTLCLAWPGALFARSAISALRTRTLSLDVPIALGLYLGGAWGIWKTIAGAGDIYFDSISALVFFLLAGRFIQQRQQRYASDAVELLFSVAPSVARRIGIDGAITDVSVEALRRGDTVEVRPGDSVPADGEVLSGVSDVDVSLMTGESLPVSVSAGDQVCSGSVNLTSPIRVRVETAGENARIGRLMRLVEDASRRRAAIVRLADRWGGWMLWILLALATITLIAWWHAGPAIAVDRAAALLIATCPCGLGLATPLAMTIAIGRAARRGMLIKGGDALQTLAHPGIKGTVILDKTGTVTLGRLSLVRWWGDAAVRPMLAALESHSSHPAARALSSELASTADGPLIVRDVIQHAGGGIEGIVAGRNLMAGTRPLLESRNIAIGDGAVSLALSAVAEGHSPVFVALDGTCVAVAALGDPVRPDACDAIKRLQGRGWRVTLLSGDHPDVVRSVARTVQLDPQDCRGGVSPEGKLAAVREMSARHTVVMVGDGVNDAAALAAATVGIAVRGGAEASLAAADISNSREGLGPLVELFEGATRTMRTIHWTIAASLAYNVAAAGLSMAGLISPLLAAFIMPASSLTVLAICLRSSAFRSGFRRTETGEHSADSHLSESGVCMPGTPGHEGAAA